MIKRILKLKEKMVGTAKEIARDESGMELLQIVIISLLAVVLGGILLTFFTGAFDDIGALMVDKIKSIFTL